MYFKELKKALRFSVSLAKANFKLRNEGTYLGILWYLLNPVLLFILLFLVFSDRLGSTIPYYPAYLFLGIIMFNFFLQVTQESTRTIFENSGLVKSLPFPRESLVGAVALRTLFSHVFEIILLVIVIIMVGISPLQVLWYIPILIMLFIFSLGVSLLLSAVTVYFIDVSNIWGFLSRLIWFGTPIFYAIEGQTKLWIINLFNPLFYFITLARDIIIYQKVPEIWFISLSIIYVLLSFTVGYFIFAKLKSKFAEYV